MSGLGQGASPGDLIDGDPLVLREQVARWEEHARSAEAAATEYRGAVAEPWVGRGADAFEAVRAKHLGRARSSAFAYREAAAVLAAHAAEIESGLRCAERAIGEWNRGEQQTVTARHRYDEEARAQSVAFALPVVSVFVDPGVATRDNAEALLADARDAVERSGSGVARELRAIAERAFTGSVFGGAPLPTGLAEVMAHAGEKKLLRELRRMSAVELEAYAREHPELLDRLLDLGPAHIAAWWRSLDASARARLAAGLPRVVGNLDGVDPRTRSDVNERMLKADIARLEREIQDAEKLLGSPDAGTRAAARALIDSKEKLLGDLAAIRKAFGAGPAGNPPRELYAYQPGEHTRAALSTGLIEDAEHVSLLVPGMGTTARDIGSYTLAATNLRELQFRLSDIDLSKLAVIAWLDYDPPGPMDIVGVTRNGLAEAGADRLVHSLQGIHAVSGWEAQSPHVSVVAHSYGTNVASVALARPDVGAGNLVMLGSAGVSGGAPVAGALNVPLGHVYATQAVADEWAPIGQLVSGRTDPTNARYGAHVFSSEEKTIDGRELAGVTRHGPFGAEGGLSYLDNLSSAQYAAAKATIGQGVDLEHEGTPDDRVGERARARSYR